MKIQCPECWFDGVTALIDDKNDFVCNMCGEAFKAGATLKDANDDDNEATSGDMNSEPPKYVT